LQEAIQGKLVQQDSNDEPASVLLERIKEEKTKLFKDSRLKKKDLVDSVIFKGEDNKYYEKIGSQVTCIDDDIPFEIPSSWSWIRLGNYTDVIGGYAFQSQDLKSENGCRVIRISDISEDGLVNTRIVRYNGNLELSQYRIYNSDILMAMTGGTVGKSLLLKSENKEMLLLNQRVAIIRNTWFDVNYIDTVIKSAYIKSIIDNSKNSTNDNISMADITGFLIPIPPLNEQHRIINKLEFVIASIMR
jgi:type I restriction enzyme S subunit